MRRTIIAATVIASIAAVLGLPSHAAASSSRVIVSSTLNSTLHVFDASTLSETQPPVPSKGTSPVRLWVQRFGGKTFLLSANHGVQGSVGVFDLDNPLAITELPASPFPSGGQGSVGIAAGLMGAQQTPMVFVTNTVQALGGCGLPQGSVTGFDASLLATAGVLRSFSTQSTGGTIPYAVAFNGGAARAYASNNCNDSLVSYSVGAPPSPTPVAGDYTLAESGRGVTGDAPDAVLYDELYDRVYVNNIGGSSVSVFAPALPADHSALTTIPLPPRAPDARKAGPIDATLADSPSGAHWLITSNGSDDSVSIIDRARIEACILGAAPACTAEIARISTGVAGGAPEGVAYDSATNRVFVINKPIGAPSLTVIQLKEEGGVVTGAPMSTIPLQAAGAGTPIPDIIAFDVVVQTR